MPDYPTFIEWLNLLVRWMHVFTAILWIGQTYFFTWLDGQLTREEAHAKAGERAQVWMVHSGGFYIVDKQKGVQLLPRTLHWFRWEAMLTWLTGMGLLTIVYYMGGVLIDKGVRDISVTTGVGISLGLLCVAWVVYDLMVRSPLGKSELLFAAVSFALIVGVAYGLTRTFSGRAAYIHVGAMFGTIMASNVWMRILPAQRRMIAATRAGEQPDMSFAERAKLRSKHNTYMVVPLVFTMLSNHFASTYGNEQYNWLILSALVLLGWVAAHFIRRA